MTEYRGYRAPHRKSLATARYCERTELLGPARQTAGAERAMPVFGRLTPGEIVTPTARETAIVWERAARAAAELSAGQDPVEAAAGLITGLPPRMIVALHHFRVAGSVHNALLLRGVCGELTGLPATPATVTPELSAPAVEAAALLLLSVSLLLGEPFTFRSLHDGRLVQHVTPVPGQERAQTGAGSAATLQWHVEDGFTADRCDYFALLCLRGHPGAVTYLAPVRDLDLAAEVVAVLREPRFVIAPDPAHHLADASAAPAVPVLSGPAADPEICFGEADVRPADPGDRRAAAALTALTAALDRAAIGHELRPGDLLIADNRRTVHGRSVFRPRYDGADRWLLRAMTCSSIRAHRRRGARRALG
ncbi:TauD/TfdA family dioxygenase [Nocardia wallacei]|uniref:TauD/TfdA family dioxygenase n=1 Tax=Nocardia wallacei TaxID=480035 RepID=UPI00245693A7|nr:TauD/TfdA family dioxygenase [Nocardia wallacei]